MNESEALIHKNFVLAKLQMKKYRDTIFSLGIERKQIEAINISAIHPKVVFFTQPSITDLHPVSPKIIKTMAVAIGVGLILGLLLAFLSHKKELLRKREEDFSIT
jgi:uncharacterized protein involved in exopolysaccharide biosynthesis